MTVYQPRGLYYEEMEIGYKVVTAGRTISEADIMAFAGISGDWNAIHVDAEYAKTAGFGERVAHGMLVLSIATGLAMQMGF
ncbi:MAG TPA: MaoC/PaaZ C-terminal domain-containing protein, partial [Anaerolineae bacterium]|nr:MaoC/PaaZ C-terminal domain-containing protein [Anaerolineae bacterium]